MQRCKLCHKEVRWIDGSWKHRARKHSCKDPENIDGTEGYDKPQQRVCRKCEQCVKLAQAENNNWKYVHEVEGNCKTELSNGETRVPLKVIFTPGGPWTGIDLKFLPISKKAKTCVAMVEAGHIAGGSFNIYDRKGLYVVKGLGEIPRTCHPTLESALNNIRYRIWRYNNGTGNWKYRKAELEVIRRRDILATIEQQDNCPCDWCPHYAENANECCGAPDLETMEKEKCPYYEEKSETPTT